MSRNLAITATTALALASAALGQDRLIAIDSSRAIYEINMATGAKTQIGFASTNAGTTGGLAYDPGSGTLYLTSTSLDSLFTLDLETGAATLIGPYDPTTTAIVMHGLEWDVRTNTLYAASFHNGGLYSVNTTTGAATLVGPTGMLSFVNLGYNSATDVLYGTSSGDDSFYRIDPLTGIATLIGPMNGPTNPHGLAFNTTNGMLYLTCTATDTLYTIDQSTGAATVVGSTGAGNLLGLVFIPDPAPPVCYPNCDESTAEPILNVQDFTCFLQRYAAGESYANCDQSTLEPVLNVQDFTCFLQAYATGCR